VSEPTDELTLERRQAIFLALVESQDAGLSPTDSRTQIAKQFSVTVAQVKEIEKEGLAEQWPPL
jgi:hypothetical protein